MVAILNDNTFAIDAELQSLMLYSYGIFTTFLSRNGKVKGARYHFERLRGDSKVLFGVEPSEVNIRRNIKKFIHELGEPNQVAIRVTLFPVDFSLANPGDIENLNILVTGRTHSSVNSGALKLVLIEAERTLPLQKTTNMIVNLKARSIAQIKGYDDALIVRKGLLTEGPMWNIFFTNGDTIFTPPIEDNLLPGIARRQILESASQYGLRVCERSIAKGAHESYESCFIANSVIGVSTVNSIDNKLYNFSSEAINRVKSLYADIVDELL